MKLYKIYKNKVLLNRKGKIVKFVSKKNKFFKGFGEVYLNYISKNKIKGWNLHKKNKCLLICAKGEVIFHLINQAGLEKKISLKECSGKILEIPKKTWFAFRSKKNSLIVNFIKEPHDKKETLKKERVKNYIINN